MKRYNGMNDIIFKNTFYIDKNIDLLKWLIEGCLNIKIDEIELRDKELSKKNKLIKSKIVDTLIKSDGKIFNVEINNGNSEQFIRDRNLGYLANIYSNALNSSENYYLQPITIQINLTSNNGKIHEQSKYTLINEYGEVWSYKFIIYEFNVDKIKKTYYNKCRKEQERFKPLVMLTSSSYELEKLCIGDERVKRYKDRVNELNDDPEFTVLMSDEEDNRKLKATREYLWNLKVEEFDKSVSSRIQQLSSKEELLSSKEEQLSSKEEQLSSKEEQLSSMEQKLTSREQQLDKESERLSKMKKELEKKLNELNKN